MKFRFGIAKKLKSDARKVPKQAETKTDSEIIPQNYNFETFAALKTIRINLSRT